MPTIYDSASIKFLPTKQTLCCTTIPGPSLSHFISLFISLGNIVIIVFQFMMLVYKITRTPTALDHPLLFLHHFLSKDIEEMPNASLVSQKIILFLGEINRLLCASQKPKLDTPKANPGDKLVIKNQKSKITYKCYEPR